MRAMLIAGSHRLSFILSPSRMPSSSSKADMGGFTLALPSPTLRAATLLPEAGNACLDSQLR